MSAATATEEAAIQLVDLLVVALRLDADRVVGGSMRVRFEGLDAVVRWVEKSPRLGVPIKGWRILPAHVVRALLVAAVRSTQDAAA